MCGRGREGIYCAVDNGTGALINTSLWQAPFSDAAGWTAPYYYSTIQFPDVNGDGKADVCGRGAEGINCALSNGSSFGGVSIWSSFFSDANGWTAPYYYSTIRIVGRVLCGRGAAGIYCAFSNSLDRSENLTLESSNESDVAGWTLPQYYKTMQLTRDFKLAERGSAGIYTSSLTPLPLPDQLSISSVAEINARRAALIFGVCDLGAADSVQHGVMTDV